jgi:hypothetical protein
MSELAVGGPYEAVIVVEEIDQPGFVRVTARWVRNGQAKAVSADVAGSISCAFAQRWAGILEGGGEPPQ